MKLLIWVCIIVGVVDGWSTLNSANKAHVDYYYKLQHGGKTFDDCKDFNDVECEKVEKYCETNFVKQHCKRTCGLCPAVSPMSCESSPFGCCWDNITASGPFGRDCPECADKHISCIENLPQCDIGHVRRACPITCDVRACVEGTHNCFDDPRQAAFCKVFKQSGFCIIDPGLMQAYCRKTCNFCNLNFQITNEEFDRYKVKEKNVDLDQNSEKKHSTLEETEEENMDTKDKKIDDSNIKDSTKKEVKESDIAKYLLPEFEKKSARTETNKKVEEKESETKKESIERVNEQLEKKTAALIDDLIQDSMSQHKTPKKRTKDKHALKKREKAKSHSKRSTKVEELETLLLDMLLKEKSKDDV